MGDLDLQPLCSHSGHPGYLRQKASGLMQLPFFTDENTDVQRCELTVTVTKATHIHIHFNISSGKKVTECQLDWPWMWRTW